MDSGRTQSAFIADPIVLERELFRTFVPRQGAKTVLNVNYLPDLLQNIKERLTAEELLRLEDYHLQNYLVELSLDYGGERSLTALREGVLSHIRQSDTFWYQHNNQSAIDEEQQMKRHAIKAYH